jgi:hypothetical protein
VKKKMLAATAVLSASVLPAIYATPASAQLASVYRGGPGAYDGLSGTVTAILNGSSGTSNTFVVDDGTASVLLYNIPTTAYAPTVGDNITFGGPNAGYQGAPEFTATNSSYGTFTFEGLNSAGNVVPPTVLTIPQFVAAGTGSTTETAVAPNAEAIVTLDNVSILTAAGAFPSSLATNTTYKLFDSVGDSTSFYGYKSDSAVAAAITAANAANPGGYTGTYDITGYTDVYYGVPEIYPTSVTEVSPAPVPEPASLGALALGAMGLLTRRRRRA